MITINKQSLMSLLAGLLPDPSILKDIQVSSITLDSRQVQVGGLFLSSSNDEQQRNVYLEQAISLGAGVVLYDQEHGEAISNVTALGEGSVKAYAVKQLAEKAGEIASRFYGHPSLALTVIAVTGTNGKTSVSQFIAQSLESLGLPCGIVGTLGMGRLNSLTNTGMTTPDPVTLQAILAGFCQQNIDYAVIEASSHALEQGRLNSVDVDVAVLTNLTRDHLDYHKTMDDYAAAKARLFSFPNIKTAVINGSDSFGQDLMSNLSSIVNVWSYSSQGDNANFMAQNIQATQQGMQFDIVSESGSVQLQSKLLGHFNVDNLLAAFASLAAIDIPFGKITHAINQCHSVDGRMESYGSEGQTQVVVDFAHTPDALTHALKSLKNHIEHGELWCVFGCGGDRDKGKRAQMGRSAAQYADKIVLTDDNPRSEAPKEIVNDILSGIVATEKVYIEHERKQAIHYAINNATEYDVVLIAGKGHEKYQEISGIRVPFSDADVVAKLLSDKAQYGSQIGVEA